MLNKLTRYAWMIAFVFIACPRNTTFAQSDIPTAGQIWKKPGTGMEFVWVPGGCYEMGCGSWTNDCERDEKPVHEVCLDAFWIAKTEVTQGQWKRVMGKNPSKHNKGDNYPVDNVSWDMAKSFAKKLSAMNDGAHEFRLPTEAEWEYACRSGGKPEMYAGGSDSELVAWHLKNSDKSTHPVAMKAPNGLGAFDMSGNVLEWCEDTYYLKAYKKHQKENPIYQADSEYRLARGGGWNKTPDLSRCASRAAYDQRTWRSHSYGFRLVRKK